MNSETALLSDNSNGFFWVEVWELGAFVPKQKESE